MKESFVLSQVFYYCVISSNMHYSILHGYSDSKVNYSAMNIHRGVHKTLIFIQK
jgi:hypothetical protein